MNKEEDLMIDLSLSMISKRGMVGGMMIEEGMRKEENMMKVEIMLGMMGTILGLI